MGLSYRPVVVSCELLEPRALFAIAYPTAQEQLIVELINRGREDPEAEAARYGIGLNEGVPSDKTISPEAKQPLAINLNLTSSARTHSQWMLDNDVFSHTGAGGSSSHQRMTASGYAFSGSWSSGENLAYRGSTGSIDADAVSARLHADLFIDAGYPNRGHRTNQMAEPYREIGVGVVRGAFTSGSGTTYTNSVMGTENFAQSGSTVFLTGVAYTDGRVDDDFYTIGEALAGVAITAVRAGDGATYTTQTWTSGGYSLGLPTGTYTVTASGIGLGSAVTHGGVVVDARNVKRDFRPDMAVAPFATLVNGHLDIQGTPGRDAVSITRSGSILTVSRDGAIQQFSAAAVTSIAVYLGDGNDGLTVGLGVIGLYCDGGMGNDHVVGGEYNDTLTGNGNHDKIFGGPGDDRLNGSGGHDKLYGETGIDRIHGGEGWDTLDGGAHIDRLFPEAGQDTLFGQHGNDLMYTLDGEPDYIAGGSGWDTAEIDDELDLLASVETWY